MNSWWETPLCAGFLKTICDEIWSGKIVLIFLPHHTPKGFFPELKTTFANRDIKSITRINLEQCDADEPYIIERTIHSGFHLEEFERFVPSRVEEIFNCPEVGVSNLIIFEKLSQPLLKSFKEFLNEYTRLVNKKSSIHHHKILVILDPNQFHSSDFPAEPGISKILYEGVFDKLDQSLALRYLMKLDSGDITPFIENLIASLSQFDYSFSQILCEEENLLDRLLDICFKYANTKEWEKVKYIPANFLSDNEYWSRWAMGIADKKNGEVLYHSGYLILKEKTLEVNNRIWQVGIEILLPLIETIRLKILKCPRLTFPQSIYIKSTGEHIKDKFKYEIGEILFLCQKREIQFNGISKTEKDRLLYVITLAKTIRDELAHVKIPQTSDITQFYNECHKIDTIF